MLHALKPLDCSLKPHTCAKTFFQIACYCGCQFRGDERNKTGVFMKDETIPPLVELEIDAFSKQFTDQQTVDTALQVVYKLRPDLFARFAERERENLGVEEYGDEFYRVLHDEFTIKTRSEER